MNKFPQDCLQQQSGSFEKQHSNLEFDVKHKKGANLLPNLNELILETSFKRITNNNKFLTAGESFLKH